MNVIPLSAIDLGSAAVLVLLLALATNGLRLGLGNKILLAGARMTIQLLLIGLLLKQLFSTFSLGLILGLSCVMILVAGWEITQRQKRRIAGLYGYSVGVSAMFLSSFTIALFALKAVIQIDPWYTPQYAIPLVGILLGNTMTGISLGMDKLTSDIYDKRNIIEQRLYLGETWQQASEEIRKDAMRTGMVPIINAMAAAGIVSLPGTMTGQILGGSPPLEAVKYQILVMFLITAGTGFGVIVSIWLTCRNLFDKRHRLCLEKLTDTGQ